MATLVGNMGAMAIGNEGAMANKIIGSAVTGGSNLRGVQTPAGYETPIGNTYRGLGAEYFNAENIAKEDFLRNEQAARSQLERDLYFFEEQKKFSREQMSWEERMSNTAVSRMVDDMKRAGINPVMAINQGGASSPSAPGVGGSSSRGGYLPGRGNADTSSLIGSILSLVGGIYGAAANHAVSMLNASTAAKSKTDTAKIYAESGMRRDNAWRDFYSKDDRNYRFGFGR